MVYFNPDKIYNFENTLRFQHYESFLIGFLLQENSFLFPRRLLRRILGRSLKRILPGRDNLFFSFNDSGPLIPSPRLKADLYCI